MAEFFQMIADGHLMLIGIEIAARAGHGGIVQKGGGGATGASYPLARYLAIRLGSGFMHLPHKQKAVYG